MKLNDANLRALPLTQAGQRDYPDDLVRGLSIRVGKQTKTFMILIRSGANRSRVKLGSYPECSLSRARQLARDKLAAACLANDELPSITIAEALDTFIAFAGPSSGRVPASAASTS
jgi:Arm domain-containing DNA-binding protein